MNAVFNNMLSDTAEDTGPLLTACHTLQQSNPERTSEELSTEEQQPLISYIQKYSSEACALHQNYRLSCLDWSKALPFFKLNALPGKVSTSEA